MNRTAVVGVVLALIIVAIVAFLTGQSFSKSAYDVSVEAVKQSNSRVMRAAASAPEIGAAAIIIPSFLECKNKELEFSKASRSGWNDQAFDEMVACYKGLEVKAKAVESMLIGK